MYGERSPAATSPDSSAYPSQKLLDVPADLDLPADEEILAAYPYLRLDNRNKHFYGAFLRHALVAARCRDCGTWHTPLRSICPACWSSAVVVTPVSGRGFVYALTLLHQGPPDPDVDYSGPWPIAAVEVVEQPGLRFAATIVDCPPHELRVGLEVELTWIQRGGAPWFAFRPAAEASGSNAETAA